MTFIDKLQDAREAKRRFGNKRHALDVLGTAEGDPGPFSWTDIGRFMRAHDKERKEVNEQRATAPMT